jgi:hypothetical protein
MWYRAVPVPAGPGRGAAGYRSRRAGHRRAGHRRARRCCARQCEFRRGVGCRGTGGGGSGGTRCTAEDAAPGSVVPGRCSVENVVPADRSAGERDRPAAGGGGQEQPSRSMPVSCRRGADDVGPARASTPPHRRTSSHAGRSRSSELPTTRTPTGLPSMVSRSFRHGRETRPAVGRSAVPGMPTSAIATGSANWKLLIESVVMTFLASSMTSLTVFPRTGGKVRVTSWTPSPSAEPSGSGECQGLYPPAVDDDTDLGGDGVPAVRDHRQRPGGDRDRAWGTGLDPVALLGAPARAPRGAAVGRRRRRRRGPRHHREGGRSDVVRAAAAGRPRTASSWSSAA